jgi:hypothetical protein
MQIKFCFVRSLTWQLVLNLRRMTVIRMLNGVAYVEIVAFWGNDWSAIFMLVSWHYSRRNEKDCLKISASKASESRDIDYSKVRFLECRSDGVTQFQGFT